jgi:outer membrane translocation and assembly module TamA
MEGYYYGSETNHEFGSSYSSMEGLGLEIIWGLSWMEKKKEEEEAK